MPSASVWTCGSTGGVDALLGRQTRDHDDIDLFVERRDGARYAASLRRAGFAEQLRPFTADAHTVWTDDRGRTIDLHLFETGADGELLFEGGVYPPETFGAQGRIAGKAVSSVFRLPGRSHSTWGMRMMGTMRTTCFCCANASVWRYRMPTSKAGRQKMPRLSRKTNSRTAGQK